MFRTIAIVARKELLDCARDKRSLVAAIAVTIAGPLVAGVAIGRTGNGIGALAVFLLVSTFVTGMSLAIDVTAGERERRSLEPLLLTHAHPFALAAGKWAAVATLNAGGLLLTLACVVVVLLRLPQNGVPLGIFTTLVLIAGLPLAALAAAMQLAIATNARTSKEGQTYLSLLLFAPMISGMLLEFSRARAAAWRRIVPIASQQETLSLAIRGETPNPVAMMSSSLVALFLAALIVHRASVLLTRERIVFGR